MSYIFINRDKKSSVYNEVARILMQRKGAWKCGTRNSPVFNLMLGDRNNLPYNRLGQQPGVVEMVNYYRGSSELCKKVSSIRLLKEYRQQFGLEDYDWLPESYIIVPRKLSHDRAAAAAEDDHEHVLRRYASRRDIIWIAKVSSGAKGLGIDLSRNVQELLDGIDTQDQSYVLQRYIERPLLLPGSRKFDIRVWVVLDQSYKIYMYKEGVVRTCSEEYDVDDLSKLTSHLSNHCLQEELSPHYGQFEPNNEIFFSQFSRILKELSKYQCNLEDGVMPQIDRVVIQCFEAIQDKISAAGLTYQSFQLFGFDFLLDDNYKIWLLEVNGAPAASSDLLGDMAEAIVQLCVDPVYPVDQINPTHKRMFRQLNKEDDR